MWRRLEIGLVLVLAAPSTAACMRPAPPQQSAPAPAPSPEGNLPKAYDGPLNGEERVAWVQPVAAGTKASDLTFFVYVDGKKLPLPGAECGLLEGSRHHLCKAALPVLAPGRHTLRFAAARTVDGQEKTSALSEPLIVVRSISRGSI